MHCCYTVKVFLPQRFSAFVNFAFSMETGWKPLNLPLGILYSFLLMEDLNHMTSNTYFTLEAQLNKLARHNRQGSYRTKERYYMAMKRFCHFLAEEYHLQKLSNISGKHLVAYVLWMQEKGLSASTIKTDLAAIRFFHDKISNPKYILPTNSELGVELERRRFGDTDRTWSTAEFNRILGKALERNDYILAFYLARYAGLRIHECLRIDTAIARQAIREQAITIKGKGGKIRTVPINAQIVFALEKCLAVTPAGHKLLVPDGVPTDKAIHQLQQFIVRHREGVRDPESDRSLTFHGLRHTYAAEKYRQLIADGFSELDAHLTVSQLLGHERADVTNIYLASVPKAETKPNGNPSVIKPNRFCQ